MLLVIHGTDFKKARAKISSLMKGLQKKRPQAELFTFTDETFSPDRLQELLGGQGLFERKYIVLLDRAHEAKEGEVIAASAQEMQESDNVFVVYTPEMPAAQLKKLKKDAYEVYTFTQNEEKKKKYKPFDLTDAVAARNPKKAWVELQRARRAGKTAEELFGVLFWQIKTLLVVQDTTTAKEAGMKPFVYNKTKKALSRWHTGDIQKLSRQFVVGYHQARRGHADLDNIIERTVLDL